MEQCFIMVLTMVLTVLKSTSYIAQKLLIVVGWIEVSKLSILLAMNTMMFTMAMLMVKMIV
eukprot:11452584-Ditylum_brightwellii.AAC.1